MQLKDLMKNIDYKSRNVISNLDIKDVVYDSRKVSQGCLFVCLIGYERDGHDYIDRAIKNGATAILASKNVDTQDVPLILVEDTRYALAIISANFFNHPAKELTTIGITGTKGKTTTSFMIKSILEKERKKVGIIGTIGVIIANEHFQTNNTTPESYEIQFYLRKMVEAGCEYAVLEVSSLGLKWHRTDGVLYDIGVFTNFSPDHVGSNEHSSLDEYKQCKSLLFQKCKLGLVNLDDTSYMDIIKNHTCEIQTFGFSTSADLVAQNQKLIRKPGYLGIHFETYGMAELSVKVNIPGNFSVYNALAATHVCLNLNVSQRSILDGLNSVKVKGRVEIIPTPYKFTLLIDYAHNAVSMENILTTLRAYNPKRLICMFGAGGNRAKSRRYEMGKVCGNLADLSVITADNSRFEDVMDIISDIKQGMKKTCGKSIVIPDRKQAIKYCLTHAQENDIVVLAGKGHEEYQEIRGKKYPFDERKIVSDIITDLKE